MAATAPAPASLPSPGVIEAAASGTPSRDSIGLARALGALVASLTSFDAVQAVGDPAELRCVVCDGRYPRPVRGTKGHAPDCAWAIAKRFPLV